MMRSLFAALAALIYFAFAAPTWAQDCEVGRKFSYTQSAKAGLMQLEIFGVKRNAKVVEIVAKQGLGNAGPELVSAVRAGKVERVTEEEAMAITVEDVDVSLFPEHLSYLTGESVCRGRAPLRKDAAKRRVEFALPFRGSELAQTTLLLPFSAMKAGGRLCIVAAPYPVYHGEGKRVDFSLCDNERRLPGYAAGQVRYVLMPVIKN